MRRLSAVAVATISLEVGAGILLMVAVTSSGDHRAYLLIGALMQFCVCACWLWELFKPNKPSQTIEEHL